MLKRTPLKRSTRPLKRTPLKRSTRPLRREGKVGRQRRRDKASALDTYFKKHGWVVDGLQLAKCQICGDPMVRGQEKVDPCHKIRSSQSQRKRGIGGEGPENIVAGQRACHTWMDDHISRGRVAVNSPVNCLVGGVIQWPEEMKQSLAAFKAAASSAPQWAGRPGPETDRPAGAGNGSGPGTT